MTASSLRDKYRDGVRDRANVEHHLLRILIKMSDRGLRVAKVQKSTVGVPLRHAKGGVGFGFGFCLLRVAFGFVCCLQGVGLGFGCVCKVSELSIVRVRLSSAKRQYSRRLACLPKVG